MLVLGIEGTAHTLGAGIIEDEKVLSDVRRVYKPEGGGIHPRDASRFFADNFGGAVREALEKARLHAKDIELVAFSRGPGLPPCLHVAAVGARAFSKSIGKPLIGVNHCVAHIEIGIQNSGFNDPLSAFVSGANTQILALKEGRYRVFGETLDIGMGNMLDKFGRAVGLGYPAGPKIEELAKRGKYIELPYTVKGTDLSLSGILTATIRATEKNSIEDACYSLQENSFSMLAEATERALHHLGREELLLVGGVANNKRLQAIMRRMAGDNGIAFGCPAGYCGDNAVMIAQLGRVMHEASCRTDGQVDPRFRTDDMVVEWRAEGKSKINEWRGAEARVKKVGGGVSKERIEKSYRIVELDTLLRKRRTQREANILTRAKSRGMRVPGVIDVQDYAIIMELVDGRRVDTILDKKNAKKIADDIIREIAKMHEANIIHNDLTTSNMIMGKDSLYFIDFGLSFISQKVEDKAVDLLVLKKSLNANHPAVSELVWDRIIKAYPEKPVIERLEVAEKRGRYL